jgi:FdrA protein
VLDLVLGEGAHPDPASEIAPAIEEAKRTAAESGRVLVFAVIVIGTDEDSQHTADQIAHLKEAGALIYHNTPDAIYTVASLVNKPAAYNERPLSATAFRPPISVINIGLETFFTSLEAQGADVVQVDWRPPAGGNENLMSLLAQLK